MRLRDPELLASHMKHRDFSQARLARYVGCSRQFIHLLITGERVTCSREVGELIEEALQVLPTTLFVPKKSPAMGPKVPQRRRSAA